MIKADDGDGHTNEVTVKILAAKPTAAPTPEPPGFEAVFANFFASQKPLLKMLRHCRHVSNRILSAEEKEVNTYNTNSKNRTTKF